jgi:UDP-glucose 4-epimerase
LRTIVTGASGFIGKNFLLHAPDDFQIVALYNKDVNFPKFLKDNGLEQVIAVKCDLTNPDEVKRVSEEVGRSFDTCLYLAGNSDPSKSVEDPIYDLKNNVLALLNFLNNFNITKFIYFSSGAVYDGHKGLVNPSVKLSPTLPYAITKLSSENYIKFFHKKMKNIESYLILRFFGAYGPYEPERKIFTKLVKKFLFERENKFVVRGDGNNYIDAMFVKDAVEGILKMMESDAKDLTIDFCSGRPLRINSLVKKVARIFGIENLEIVHEGETKEYNLFYASPKAQERIFGIKVKTSLEDGLRELANHLRSRDHEEKHLHNC